jgi:hypothetical protein
MPEVEIATKLDNNKYLFKSFEIQYNCNTSVFGQVKLELTIATNDCPTFKIYWNKFCNSEGIYFLLLLFFYYQTF